MQPTRPKLNIIHNMAKDYFLEEYGAAEALASLPNKTRIRDNFGESQGLHVHHSHDVEEGAPGDMGHTGHVTLEKKANIPRTIDNRFASRPLNRKRMGRKRGTNRLESRITNSAKPVESVDDPTESSSASDEGYEGDGSENNSSDKGSGSSSDDGYFNGNNKKQRTEKKLIPCKGGNKFDHGSERGSEKNEDIEKEPEQTQSIFFSGSSKGSFNDRKISEATPFASTCENMTVAKIQRNDGDIMEDEYLSDRTVTRIRGSLTTVTASVSVLSSMSKEEVIVNKEEKDSKEAKSNPTPYFRYVDRSQEDDDDPLVPLTSPSKVPSFPAKMMALLTREDISTIIRWRPHGRSWCILNIREFELRIIPVYFEHSRISSFIRQAKGWGFRRLNEEGKKHCYYNEYFLRGMPHLIKKMPRPHLSKKNDVHIDMEPNLSKISLARPLPERVNPGDMYASMLEAINDCILVGGPKARLPVIHTPRKSPKPLASPNHSISLETSKVGTDSIREESSWQTSARSISQFNSSTNVSSCEASLKLSPETKQDGNKLTNRSISNLRENFGSCHHDEGSQFGEKKELNQQNLAEMQQELQRHHHQQQLQGQNYQEQQQQKQQQQNKQRDFLQVIMQDIIDGCTSSMSTPFSQNQIRQPQSVHWNPPHHQNFDQLGNGGSKIFSSSLATHQTPTVSPQHGSSLLMSLMKILDSRPTATSNIITHYVVENQQEAGSMNQCHSLLPTLLQSQRGNSQHNQNDTQVSWTQTQAPSRFNESILFQQLHSQFQHQCTNPNQHTSRTGGENQMGDQLRDVLLRAVAAGVCLGAASVSKANDEESGDSKSSPHGP